jgi:hypothetical protein
MLRQAQHDTLFYIVMVTFLSLLALVVLISLILPWVNLTRISALEKENLEVVQVKIRQKLVDVGVKIRPQKESLAQAKTKFSN